MSVDGDRLRDAAHRLEAIAEKATPRICPQWTYSAVRHINRNCDIECYHPENPDAGHDGARFDENGVSHWGWDRYEDAPWITAMGAQTADPIALLLNLAAIAADQGESPFLVRSALALVDAIAWPAAEEAAS
jgi:hypothetical protein